jgi:hypothetical protein
MRRNCKHLGAAIFLQIFFYSSFAQTTLDTTSASSPVLVKKYYTALHVQTGIQTGSNGMNQRLMNQLGFGGYISSSDLENAEKRIKERSRMGMFISSSVQFRLSKKTDTASRKTWRLKPTHIVILQENRMGSSFNKDLWQLVFRGNDPYLGQTLDISKTRFSQFATRTVSVQFQDAFLNRNKNTSFGFSVGVSQLLSWRNMFIPNGTIYTDPDRNFVDVQYQMDFRNTGRDDLSGKGFGIITGLDFHHDWKENQLSFYIHNLGFYQVNDAQRLYKEMDTPVHVKQSTVVFKSTSSSNWSEYLQDTINPSLSPDTGSFSGTVFAPVQFRLNYGNKRFALGLDYMAIAGYVPRLTIAAARNSLKIKGINNFYYTPEVQLGGFDTYNINLGLAYRLVFRSSPKENRMLLQLKVMGIEALALPALEHGAGLSLSLSYLMQ